MNFWPREKQMDLTIGQKVSFLEFTNPSFKNPKKIIGWIAGFDKVPNLVLVRDRENQYYLLPVENIKVVVENEIESKGSFQN